MKQFFALAALFAVLGVSAQEKQVQEPRGEKHPHQHERMDRKHGDMHKIGEKRQKPTVEQQVAQFDKYGVDAAQKKKITSLIESRDKQLKKDFEKREKEIAKSKESFQKEQQSFDKKMGKILDQDQYAKFKEDQQKHFKGKDKEKIKRKGGVKGEHRMYQSKKMK